MATTDHSEEQAAPAALPDAALSPEPHDPGNGTPDPFASSPLPASDEHDLPPSTRQQPGAHAPVRRVLLTRRHDVVPDEVAASVPVEPAENGHTAPLAVLNGPAPDEMAVPLASIPVPAASILTDAPPSDPDLISRSTIHSAPADEGQRLHTDPVPDDLPPTMLVDAEGGIADKPPATGWRGALDRFWLWRGRGLWLGSIAVALALYGQKLVTVDHQIVISIRWYAAAIFLMILAWLGTYKNRSMITLPLRRRRAEGTLPVRTRGAAESQSRGATRPGMARLQRLIGDRWRYLLVFAALALNLYSVTQLRADYYSFLGGMGWLLSLLLLLGAFIGERPKPHVDADAHIDEVERRTDWRFTPRLEWALFLSLFIIAFALRLYRLDDWTTGMHGDEGEAGMDAINILEGNRVSPFLTGWFAQPNFYYWGIALTMKVFGTGMGGLRMFVVLAGMLMFLPFYGLVRQWFGVRVALIATAFMAISDITIHFSRQEFSNITTPLFVTAGFFFFFWGLRSMRTVAFVLAGYAFMLSLYFYLGGRIAPILLVAALGYLFVLLPIIRFPGVYAALRRGLPATGRLRAFRTALVTQVLGVLHYYRQILVLGVACLCLVSPWLVYYLDNRAVMDARTQDKLILSNQIRMVQQFPTATHAPLTLGLRLPHPDDIYPFSPIVFDEPTPFHVQLMADGFWARAGWGQLTTTLSILTYRFDASSVYTFTQEPVSKPIEAALIILGIAFALWRWRDTRMAMLSLWFWLTVFIGGVLTIDAPYMARLIVILPTMAIFAAIPLGKLCGEFVHAVGQWGFRPRLARVGQFASAGVVTLILFWLFGQNYSDYYSRYTLAYPFSEVTGQAYFVRAMNQQLAQEGRLTAKYYNLGAHLIYWGHGDNRFLNHGVDGIDMVNPSNDLPVLDNGERDIVFMVWDLNKEFMQAIKTYYPVGEEKPFYYSANGQGNFLFNAYRVKREDIDAQRFALATYTPAQGPAIQRQEPTFGTGDALPADLVYPVQATWTGGLVAPGYGRYRFRLNAPGAASLTIDGTPVLTATSPTGNPTAEGGSTEGEIMLARGPHNVELRGTLAQVGGTVALQWSAGSAGYTAVPRKVLWYGPGTALLGLIRTYSDDPFTLQQPMPSAQADPYYQKRVDGFLGFRDSPSVLGGGGLAGRWTATLTITQTGQYEFDTYSNGGSVIYIDDKLVSDNRGANGGPTSVPGQVQLTAGSHRYDVRYAWQGGTGYLEAFWTPPGEARQILTGAVLRADPGAWPVGAVSDPGPANITAQLGDPAKIVAPDKIISSTGALRGARGIAVDSKGLIYVADTSHHRIAVLDGDGKLVRSIGQEGIGPGQLGGPEDVALGPDGKLYVLESSVPSRVQVFTTDGTFERVLAEGFCSAAGLTVGPDGLVYVADTCASRIAIYTATGETRGVLTAGDDPKTRLDQPVDVAVGSDGTIYVVDLRQRIVALDATGAIKRSWPVAVGGSQGASTLTLLQNVLYLPNPDANTIAAIESTSSRSDLFGRGGHDPGQFAEPTGSAAGPDGKLYILDNGNGRIQILPPTVFSP